MIVEDPEHTTKHLDQMLEDWMNREDAPQPQGRVVTFSGTVQGTGSAKFGPAEPQDEGED